MVTLPYNVRHALSVLSVCRRLAAVCRRGRRGSTWAPRNSTAPSASPVSGPSWCGMQYVGVAFLGFYLSPYSINQNRGLPLDKKKCHAHYGTSLAHPLVPLTVECCYVISLSPFPFGPPGSDRAGFHFRKTTFVPLPVYVRSAKVEFLGFPYLVVVLFVPLFD